MLIQRLGIRAALTVLRIATGYPDEKLQGSIVYGGTYGMYEYNRLTYRVEYKYKKNKTVTLDLKIFISLLSEDNFQLYKALLTAKGLYEFYINFNEESQEYFIYETGFMPEYIIHYTC